MFTRGKHMSSYAVAAATAGGQTPLLTRAKPTRILNEWDVIDLYQAGYTAKQVGDVLRIASSTVLRILKRRGVPRRRRGPTRVTAKAPSARAMQIAALYQGGKTLQATGAVFGITRERVRQILGEIGIPSRRRGISSRLTE